MAILAVLCFFAFIAFIVLGVISLFRKTGRAKWMFFSSLGTFILGIVFSMSNSPELMQSNDYSPAKTQSYHTEPMEKEIIENKPTISAGEFNRIEIGMNYEQVTDIIGDYGELVSESEEAGTPFHTVLYQYEGEGSLGANASMMFQGGKLTNKTQYGLK
ncbi:DUF3862 domain-containing protein [Paenibacillus polymyxa]|uniref:DUF3862 domain-containing protein n=1 Tax=Paenibacillus polymyxa TaxID=1406 RepID=UPI0004715064|nr:DUF3862 domain-containing protein [Paenibacillus polymyxa]